MCVEFETYKKELEEIQLTQDGKRALVRALAEREPEKPTRRPVRPLRMALIAACVCLLLMGTAFAANEITGGLVFNRFGDVILGRFERGRLVDGNGEEVDPAQLDDAQLASGEYTVHYPDTVSGIQLTEEDGRVILYGQNNLIEVRLDITDELLENGAFHYYEEREENYWLSLTVYSVALEEHTQDNPLVYEGAAYLAGASGMNPNGHGGVHRFEFHDVRFVSGSGYYGY